MPVISIIVPIYNVEKYLKRCLDSILAQTFSDYECILVDDGSPDNCPKICDEYAGKDGRFIAIHQKNKGTAFARDAGVKNAGSEFITFVDGDDWLETNALEALYTKQTETNADIILAGFTMIYWGGVRQNFPSNIDPNSEVLEYYFVNITTCSSMWGKLYRKSLFSGYVVPSTNTGEDDMVNVQIFSKTASKKLQKIDAAVYNYDKRANGITTVQFKNKRKGYRSITEYPAFISQQKIGRYLDDIPAPPSVKSAYLYHANALVIVDYLLRNKNITTHDACFIYKQYYKPCFHKKLLRLQYRILFNVFFFCFPLGFLYRFLLKTGARLKNRTK
jgi:glycosyltransferase involved in cell wall biosynthesis